MGHMQPRGPFFCRPATVYAMKLPYNVLHCMATTSWVNGRYLLQTQIYYCDTNYSTHCTQSQIPFIIIIIIIVVVVVVVVVIKFITAENDSNRCFSY